MTFNNKKKQKSSTAPAALVGRNSKKKVPVVVPAKTKQKEIALAVIAEAPVLTVATPAVTSGTSAPSGTKVRRKISRRKPGSKPVANYFDENTQQAIVDYQKTPDVEEKKKIYA